MIASSIHLLSPFFFIFSFSFLFCSSSSSSSSYSSLTEVFAGVDEGFAVVLNLLDDRIAHEVDHGQVGHGSENFDDGWVVDLVVREVQDADGRALEQAAQVVGCLQPVVVNVERGQSRQTANVLDALERVVAHVQLVQLRQRLQALELVQAVLLQITKRRGRR